MIADVEELRDFLDARVGEDMAEALTLGGSTRQFREAEVKYAILALPVEVVAPEVLFALAQLYDEHPDYATVVRE